MVFCHKLLILTPSCVRYEPPKYDDYEELERKYWKNITFIAPLYGADVCGTVTDDTCDHWNIGRLGSILDYVNQVGTYLGVLPIFLWVEVKVTW